MEGKGNERNSLGAIVSDDIYELRLRTSNDGFDLTSEDFRGGPIWYSGPDAVRHAVAFARYRSRRRARHATVRVLDTSGSLMQTYQSGDDFRW
jgi:hypothetical protein